MEETERIEAAEKIISLLQALKESVHPKPLNPIASWMELLGDKARASKLRKLLPKLLMGTFEGMKRCDPPPICPTRILFGEKASYKLYANPRYRPALDAFDAGTITKGDLMGFCVAIEKGQYKGPVYQPKQKEKANEPEKA